MLLYHFAFPRVLKASLYTGEPLQIPRNIKHKGSSSSKSKVLSKMSKPNRHEDAVITMTLHVCEPITVTTGR